MGIHPRFQIDAPCLFQPAKSLGKVGDITKIAGRIGAGKSGIGGDIVVKPVITVGQSTLG